MNELPFDDLLTEVQDIRAGAWVDIEERLALQTLLRRYDGASARELRDAVAALLARTADEAARIAKAFDRLYRASGGADGPAGARAEWRPEREPESHATGATASQRGVPWRQWCLAVSVLVALIWTTVTISHPFQGGNTGGAAPTAEPNATGGTAGKPPIDPEHPVQKEPLRYWYWPPPAAAFWAAGAVTALAFLYLGRHGARRQLTAWRSKRWHDFVDLEGPRDYRVSGEFERPPPPDAVESMTAALEAIAGKLNLSTRIDVAETVRLTAQRAAVTLAREASTSAGRLLVLRDVGQPMVKWRVKIDRLIADLQRETVVELLCFDQDPTLVSPAPGRRGRPLHEWTLHCGGLPLLMLTDGRFLEKPDFNRTFLRRAFEPWPLRVVLHPVEHPQLWPVTLNARDGVIPAFPMTPGGYRAMLRWLPSRARDARARFQPTPSQLWPGDVLRLRAMLSFLPHPTFELAELMRAKLMPRTPDAVLLALDPVLFANEGSREIDEARAWLRSWFQQNPGSAQEYEQFWERHVNQPPPSTAAYQRYMRDRAVMRLHLSAEPAADQELQQMARAFAGSPVADGWQVELERFGYAHAAEPDVKLRISRLRRATEAAAYDTTGERRPRSWSTPSSWVALLAILLGLAVVPVGTAISPAATLPTATASTPVPENCGPAFDRCGGSTCLNLLVDPRNCGRCGLVCSAGLACQNGKCGCAAPLQECGGTCVDVQTSAANCGDCNRACKGSVQCVAGLCQTCPPASGLTECAGKCVDLKADARNCGACGTSCNLPNAIRSCKNGLCQPHFVCARGFANCDDKVGNGCEINLQSDTNNCGACGTVCTGKGAVSCFSGKCNAPDGNHCEPGFTDCNNDQHDGCETNLNSNTSCGSCNNKCKPGTSCQNGRCLSPTCESDCARALEACMSTCEPEKFPDDRGDKKGLGPMRSSNAFGQYASPASPAAKPAAPPAAKPAAPTTDEFSRCTADCQARRARCMSNCGALVPP